MNTTQQLALSLYAGAVTAWVVAERWRLARLTDSPLFAIIGAMFTLSFALQAGCVAIAAASFMIWMG